MSSLRQVLKQPLPYFVLAGMAVFLVDFWFSSEPQPMLDAAGVRQEVRLGLTQNLGRAPTDAELQRGIEEWLNTELLFREAVALGLEQNDAVIREHLAQKLKHLVRERTIQRQPSEAELKAALSANPNRYTRPETFDVSHVFVLRARSPETFQARVDDALAALRAGVSLQSVGDHFPRGPKFLGLSRLQLEQVLGVELKDVLQLRHQGSWQVVSGRRGAHLLRLDARHAGTPNFDTLAPALTADVEEQKKHEALSEYLTELRRKYALDVDNVR